MVMAQWQGRFILLCVALLLPIPAFTFHRLPSPNYALTRPRSTILSAKKNVKTDSTFAAAVLSTLVAVQPAILSFAPEPTIAATAPLSYREKAVLRAAEKESRKNAIKDSVAPSGLETGETGASKAKAAVPAKALSYTEKYEARKALKASKGILDERGGRAMGKQGGKTVLGSKKKQTEVDALRRKLASDKAKEKRQIEQIKMKKKQQNQEKANEDRRKKETNIARISAEKKRAEKVGKMSLAKASEKDSAQAAKKKKELAAKEAAAKKNAAKKAKEQKIFFSKGRLDKIEKEIKDKRRVLAAAEQENAKKPTQGTTKRLEQQQSALNKLIADEKAAKADLAAAKR